MTENVKKIITFASREGNKPLGIFMDKDSELQSFPTIYCGKTRADNKDRTTPVHYSTICKWYNQYQTSFQNYKSYKLKKFKLCLHLSKKV